jgi:hypothetical protein
MAAVQKPKGLRSLDQVDLGRQIARDFETNFLLAHCGLRPDFHGVSSEFLQVLPVESLPSEIAPKIPISFR